MDDAPTEHEQGPAGWRATVLAALLAALARPWTWPVALSGFLARGGVVVLALPIVVVPSTPGLALVIAPTLTPFYFGQLSPQFVALVVGATTAIVVAIVLGGLVGAWADTVLAREAALDDEVGLAPVPARRVVIRSLVARLIAHLPLALALSWGALRIVQAAYREVILPDELATPIVLRVLRDVPDAVLAVLGAWLAGETIGGLAQRRITLAGGSVARSLGWAVVRIVRAPFATLGVLLVTTAAVLVAAVLPALAAGVAWHGVRSLLAARAGLAELGVGILLFVGLWLAGLALVGAATAWRSFAWTFELYRPSDRRRDAADRAGATAGGTIGVGEGGRPGGWSSRERSGRL